ncbi:hypothetical protein AAFF_G00250270 [Aldrovandia affinis]|uniref:Ig-like domain-containing protein n=1 Tax=Aldrovandia affinis TaxID=143900 RepID=A0AAD7RD43_9TELE|nr:hypothetical protein AAFF_G00250270 [Aldrovandia affinis]
MEASGRPRFGAPLPACGFAAIAVLAAWAVSADAYMYQAVVDCEYSEDLEDMVYLVKNVFNKRILCQYDSRRGSYEGYDAFGISNAEHYNDVSWKMALRRAEVDILCKYHARYYRTSTLERRVQPSVSVTMPGTSRYGAQTLVACHVMGFYPRDIKVTWLRGGAETIEGVTSTDTLANGDWSYQLHSYLELRPRQWERVSCRVQHSSLPEPLEVTWDTSVLDSKVRKVAIGVTAVVVGVAAIIVGGVYFFKKRHGGDKGYLLESWLMTPLANPLSPREVRYYEAQILSDQRLLISGTPGPGLLTSGEAGLVKYA